MKFSVLIANYNNEKYLKSCLDSLVNQDYENIEIVIVDDCSTDNSSTIIRNFMEKVRIPVVYKCNNTNKGCGYSKSLCVELASGEVCGFVDSDDILQKGAISRMVYYHNLYKEASIISSRHYICNEKMKILYSCHYNSKTYFKNYLCNPRLSHFNTFKKKYYNETIGINKDLKLAVDQDLCLKLEEVGKVIFIDDVLYFYRTYSKSISNSKKGSQKAVFYNLVARIDAVKRRNIDITEIENLYKFKIKYNNWIINKCRLFGNIIMYKVSKK